MSTKIQTSLRLDADNLAQAEQILFQRGMDFTEAVNLFTRLIVAKQGLPFDVALPDEKTKAAMLIARSRGFAIATRNTSDFEECGVDLFNPFLY